MSPRVTDGSHAVDAVVSRRVTAKVRPSVPPVRSPALHGPPLDRSAAFRAVMHGVRDAMSLPAPMVAAGLLSIGPLAHAVGYPLAAAVASTLFVWAGPAQVLFFGGIAAGLSPVGIGLAVGLSSVRFLPMVISLLPLLRRPGQSLPELLWLSHFTTVTTWSEGLRRMPAVEPHLRVPYFLGFGHACVLLSAFATGVGYVMTGSSPPPVAAALLFLSPLFFTVSVAAGARGFADAVAIALGFLLQPIALKLIGPELDLLFVGLFGGTAAFLLDRAMRRRAA